MALSNAEIVARTKDVAVSVAAMTARVLIGTKGDATEAMAVLEAIEKTGDPTDREITMMGVKAIRAAVDRLAGDAL